MDILLTAPSSSDHTAGLRYPHVDVPNGNAKLNANIDRLSDNSRTLRCARWNSGVGATPYHLCVLDRSGDPAPPSTSYPRRTLLMFTVSPTLL